jgi:hypothetical protein
MRSLALISSPRSGSTPVAMAIAQCMPMPYFGEIFNIRDAGSFPEAVFSKAYLPEGVLSEPGLFEIANSRLLPGFHAEQIGKRVRFLRNNAKAPYLVKVFANLCPLPLEHWVEKNFDLYFLERRDLFDQMLSFLIASSLNRWYESFSRLEAPSIEVRKVDFEAFEMNIFYYKRWRQKALDRPLLYYEDFLEGGWQVVLERFSLPNNGKINPVLTVKQNLYDKRLAIKNLDQVTVWYRESILQTFAPICAEGPAA